MKKITLLSVLGFTVLLTACSSGPNDAEIKAALEAKSAEGSSALKAIGIDLGMKLDNVKKIGCSKDKEGEAYVCDIEFTVTSKNILTGNTDSKQTTEKKRFVKTEAGWRLSE